MLPTSIPGRAEPRPFLSDLAVESLVPGDTPILTYVFPDKQVPSTQFAAIQNQEDAPPCTTCGSIMVRSGACYKCSNCGTTSGCA